MNCNIKKCKAKCCGAVPIPRDTYKGFSKIRPVVKEFYIDEDNVIIAFTEDCSCPFLTYDYRCSIYDFRPEICRLFGSSDDDKMLQCKHLKSK